MSAAGQWRNVGDLAAATNPTVDEASRLPKASGSMVGRLILGLMKGFLVGVALAAAIVWGFGLPVWSVPVAYAVAALAGALTGAVAGRPIWASGAKLEATLKAFVGAFVAVVAVYGARKWLSGITLDLTAFGAGNGAIADLPAAFLPLLGATLGVLFELDNTDQPAPPEGSRRRVQVPGGESAEGEEPAFSDEPAQIEPSRRRR